MAETLATSWLILLSGGVFFVFIMASWKREVLVWVAIGVMTYWSLSVLADARDHRRPVTVQEAKP